MKGFASEMKESMSKLTKGAFFVSDAAHKKSVLGVFWREGGGWRHDLPLLRPCSRGVSREQGYREQGWVPTPLLTDE